MRKFCKLRNWVKTLLMVCLLLGLMFMCFGCAGMDTAGVGPPSVCDNVAPDESYLCEVFGSRLEAVGHTLLVLNRVAIESGAYTDADARKVANLALAALTEESITYLIFYDKILEYEKKYPELIFIGRQYLAAFQLPQVIKPKDREFLTYYIEQQVLKVLRE